MTFTPDEKNRYLEIDSTSQALRLKQSLFSHPIIPLADVTGYTLTMDGKTLAASDTGKPALKDNTLLGDAKIMGDGSWSEIQHLDLTIKTAQGQSTLKFINTRTQVASMAYSVALMDAEKVLQQLDAFYAGKNKLA